MLCALCNNGKFSDMSTNAHFSHPGHVILIALHIAQLKDIDWRLILSATRDNIKKVYQNTDNFKKSTLNTSVLTMRARYET